MVEIDEEGAFDLMSVIQRMLQGHDLDLAMFHYLTERFEIIWKAIRHAKLTRWKIALNELPIGSQF